VYYVREFPFPAQIVEIEQLSEQENLWLNKLRDVPHK
jgi:hypothetical protein